MQMCGPGMPKWAHFGPGHFFECNNHQYLLDIIVVYHNMQNQKKTNDSNSRKWQKTPDLGHFGPILPDFGPGNFFFRKSGFVTLNRL